jgi:Glu-tRNA(Gln) amidotransferase subunit E-like FAD-binding protein
MVDHLVGQGLEEPLAVGVVRNGVEGQVQDLLTEGVAISVAADFWLRTMRHVADDIQTPVTAIRISTAQIREALDYVSRGAISQDQLSTLVTMIVRSGSDKSVLDLLSNIGLSTRSDKDQIYNVLAEVLDELGVSRASFLTLSLKNQRKVRKQVIGKVKHRMENPSMHIVLELIDNELRPLSLGESYDD